MYIIHSDTPIKDCLAQIEYVNDRQIEAVIRKWADKKREKHYNDKVKKLSQETILGEYHGEGGF
jgi:hypothetical protein